ncbi:MAG: hypothetical protein ACI91B_000535 [Planctomycetota bacterium]|jgi:hypothetical protein
MKTFLGMVALAMPICGQQPFTLFYATDDIEELSASGVGGTTGNPGNMAAVFDNDAFVMVQPDATANYFAYAAGDHAAWLAYFGDPDHDGDYAEYITGDISALHVPASSPNPPTIFDCIVSFDIWIGGWGANGQSHTGTSIFPGDIVRLNRGGTWTSFLSRAQIGSGLGLTVGQTENVDALTIDESTGDIYLSFEDPTTVNGVPVENGGVLRLAAANHTVDAAGNVASVVPGSIEIVMTEAEADALAVNAGFIDVRNIQGMIIDANGGTFTATSTGLTMPNLVFATFRSSYKLLSTASGGSNWSHNGILFDTATAIGMSNTSFLGLNAGRLSALAYRPQPLAATPRHLDMGWPVSITTPGTLKLDVSGATPLGSVMMGAGLAEASVLGGYSPRVDLSSPGPLAFLNLPGSWGELYYIDPISTFPIDAQGYGSWTVALPPLPPGFAIVFQGLDLQSWALTSPVIPVVQ